MMFNTIAVELMYYSTYKFMLLFYCFLSNFHRIYQHNLSRPGPPLMNESANFAFIRQNLSSSNIGADRAGFWGGGEAEVGRRKGGGMAEEGRRIVVEECGGVRVR